MKFAKVMFLHLSVILSTGGSTPVHAGMHNPPRPEAEPPPGPEADTLQTRGRPPLEPVHIGRYGQQAGGTHPTGMHTCLQRLFLGDYF